MFGKTIALVAAAGCVTIALSACAATLRIAPAAPATTTAAPATAPPPVTPTTEEPAPTTGETWAPINWRTVAAEELGCAAATINGPHYADLNGNGMSEAVIVASCPAATSVRVLVYEDAETRRPMKRLLTVGEDRKLRTAEVTMKGSTLTVASERGTTRYTWNGTTFRPR